MLTVLRSPERYIAHPNIGTMMLNSTDSQPSRLPIRKPIESKVNMLWTRVVGLDGQVRLVCGWTPVNPGSW
jgi:hypothetical protein